MKVTITRECNCTKRLELNKIDIFETKDEAIKNAQEKCALLEEKSCKTHLFSIHEQEDEIRIDSKINTQEMF